MPSSTPSKRCSSCTSTVLPDTFEPSDNEMIIGRGRKLQQHPGNLKLRTLVKLKMKDYLDSGDKTVKSFIISNVWKGMRQESSCGGFVKKDVQTDKWVVVSDCTVRATIAQAFRDSLSPTYRSSKFSKQRRRWSKKSKAEHEAPPPPMTVFSLQRASMQNSPPLHNDTSMGASPACSISSSFLGGTSAALNNTADILSRVLKVMDEHEDLVSYTENPFEPNPILEDKDACFMEPLEPQSFANFAW